MFAAAVRASVSSFIFSCCIAVQTQAQIHLEKPGPGLDKGVLVHLEKQTKGGKPDAMGKAIGAGDFSVVCRFALPAGLPAPTAPIGILSGFDQATSHDAKAGWQLLLAPDSSLSFTAQTKEGGASVKIETLKDAVSAGRSHDVVVSVHRDARQPLSGIWVDGIELASGTFPPMDLRDSLPGSGWNESGWINSLVVYDRALTRPEIVELTLQSTGAASHLPKPAHPALPANGPTFVPQEGETIVLLGGTDAVSLAESGQLEASLLMAFPQTRFHFRNLAWEGDTVFRQDRPMNYGSLEQQLRRVNAGSVFMMFGRQECLDAAQATTEAKNLSEFRQAFEELLTTVGKVTPNIVLIVPPPFEAKDPPLPDLSQPNHEMKLHQKVIREIGATHGLAVAESSREDIAKLPSATTDGVQFSSAGLRMMADVIAGSLKLPDAVLKKGNDNQRSLTPGDVDRIFDQLQQSARQRAPLCLQLEAKNRLWHDYWRPSNWAFLYGDRTNQPSSRDPVNSQIRLFPSEQETILPMIKAAEEKIYRSVEEMQKRLP
jgi:hypothetical protein